MSPSVLLAKTKEQLGVEALREDPADNGDHRRNARPAGHKPYLLGHPVHPMTARIRAAHEHLVSRLPIMQILRYQSGVVALDREIEVSGRAGD